jgi:hypothetical protein
MYITFKIGNFKFLAANKNEYLMPPDEKLLLKKGFRIQVKNYVWKNGKYFNVSKG